MAWHVGVGRPHLPPREVSRAWFGSLKSCFAAESAPASRLCSAVEPGQESQPLSKSVCSRGLQYSAVMHPRPEGKAWLSIELRFRAWLHEAFLLRRSSRSWMPRIPPKTFHGDSFLCPIVQLGRSSAPKACRGWSDGLATTMARGPRPPTPARCPGRICTVWLTSSLSASSSAHSRGTRPRSSRHSGGGEGWTRRRCQACV